MRTIIPIILRLLADPAHPQRLRGTLQTLGQDTSQPFSDEQELLGLLRQLVAPARTSPGAGGETSNKQ